MKTLFGMTAAVLLVVMMLFVSLPETAGAAGKVSLTEMVSIKKAADEAAQAAKAQAEKAKTAEEKRLAKQLLKQAETNAEVAGDLLEAVKAGEEVSREEAEACAAIAKAVHEAAGALAAGNMGKAEAMMGRVAELGSSLPTAANARGEMQRAGADKAGKNQTFTADDMNKKGKPAEPGSSLPTAANARAEMQRAAGAEGIGIISTPVTFVCNVSGALVTTVECVGTNLVTTIIQLGLWIPKLCVGLACDTLNILNLSQTNQTNLENTQCSVAVSRTEVGCNASPSHPNDCPCSPAK